MSKCKHLNGALLEVLFATHTRYIENGVLLKYGDNNMGNLSHFEYHCNDCNKIFSFKNANRPKWLQKHIDKL